MLNIVFLFAIIAWLSFTIGFAFIGTSFTKAEKLAGFLWNARIDKLRIPPFSWFMKAYGNSNFIQSFFFVFLLNLPMHVVMFFSGYIKIGILLAIIHPFLQGSIVGMGDDKTRIYGIITAIFEVSGFAISCVLGLFGRFDLWWISAIFLTLNAVIEAGGVFIGVQGVPGIVAVKNKQYK